MLDLTGKAFHGYQILELIGQGSIAQVYKAYHATLDCLVAVKILYTHPAAQESLLRRFRQEAHAVAKLQHPNIVRVQDFGVEGDLVYIVLEFIDGPSLRSCFEESVKREEYWSLESILQLMRKVASAIDYAHQQGIVHRDIKPGNILLRVGPLSDEEDRGYTLAPSESCPVLTDFGLAYLLGEGHRSTDGTLTGTSAYMSPEQAIGERGEQASDLYSLGVILYEMITHRVPFAADTPREMTFKHVHEALPPLRDLRPDISEAVETVFTKALAKSPTERYPTASALTNAFEEAVESRDLSDSTRHPMIDVITYDEGDVIGEQYEVLAVLGKGRFSRVYRVRDTATGDTAALKLVSDSSSALDLRQEFQTLNALDHPSIAKVYDVGLLPNYLYYLKLEYIGGYSLRDCIDQGLLTLAKSVELVGDILEALSHLEDRGYIHRDIKPSNIVVTPKGAKIIDFSASIRLEDSSKTQIRTPRYMPPEVPVFGWNRTCDVFSAGLVFYEMTTGRFPFADPAAHAAWDIPHPCELNPALPPSLAEVILKALSRDPNARFQSAADMLRAVRKASLEQEKWNAEAIRPPVTTPSVVKPQIVPKQLLFELDRLTKISSRNVGHLRQLRCFGSGPPIALGNLVGLSGFVVVNTAGVQAIDPANGSRTEVVRIPTSAWVAADVSDQGNAVAAVDRSHNLSVYALPTGQSLANVTNSPLTPTGITCGDRGRFVAVTDQADQKTILWDTDTDRIVAQWPGSSGNAAFGPGERGLFAIATEDGIVHVWQIESKEEVATLDVASDKVTRLAFSSDGQLLATGGRTMRVWQVSRGRQISRWPMEEGSVVDVAFSPDSRWIAVVSDAERLELRGTTTGRKLRQWKTDQASGLIIAGDGETVHVVEGMTEVCSYDVRRGRRIRRQARDPGYVCASLSADGLHAAAAGTDGNVFLWRSQEKTPSQQEAWRHEQDPAWGIALDPTGHRLVIATLGCVDLYDIRRKRRLWQARIRKRPGHIVFSPDGRLVVVHQPGTTELLEAATGKRIKRLRADVIAVAPAGQAMAVVHKGKLYLVDLFTLQSSGRVVIPACNNLALSSTARLLALATPNNALEVWYIQGGRRLTVLSKLMLGTSGYKDRMNHLAFGSDGALLVSSGTDGTVRMWDGNTGTIRRVLTAHLGEVTSTSFGGDGRLLCSSGMDGTVRLWGVTG